MSLAHERLAARARRIALIRQRVVAAVLAAFVLAWGAVVYDGSMGTTSTAAQVTPESSTATEPASESAAEPATEATSPDTLTTAQS
jgi:hypothetical protein